jgi:hypothetical protein
MPESGTYGSVRGALSNERPYRDKIPVQTVEAGTCGAWILPTRYHAGADRVGKIVREVRARRAVGASILPTLTGAE